MTCYNSITNERKWPKLIWFRGGSLISICTGSDKYTTGRKTFTLKIKHTTLVTWRQVLGFVITQQTKIKLWRTSRVKLGPPDNAHILALMSWFWLKMSRPGPRARPSSCDITARITRPEHTLARTNARRPGERWPLAVYYLCVCETHELSPT